MLASLVDFGRYPVSRFRSLDTLDMYQIWTDLNLLSCNCFIALTQVYHRICFVLALNEMTEWSGHELSSESEIMCMIVLNRRSAMETKLPLQQKMYRDQAHLVRFHHPSVILAKGLMKE